MAAKCAPIEDLAECPVCHDGFKDPKILPCTHLVCKECVLSWLQKEDGEGSCPLCRSKILPNQGQGQRQGDLVAQVDAMPTDLALVALVESSNVLKERGTCSICVETGEEATSFCLQCDVRLCKSCTNNHRRFPSFREHEVEDLGALTAQKVAASRRGMCTTHQDKVADIYCSTHQVLVCYLCIVADHDSCSGKKTIEDVAKTEREALAKRAQALRKKGTSVAAQIAQIKDNFKATEAKVKDIFDDLELVLQKRRQEVNAEVKSVEDVITNHYVASLEQRRTALMSQAASIEHHVTSSPDDALLRMTKDLKSRLDDIERKAREPLRSAPMDFSYPKETLNQLKTTISKVGSVERPRMVSDAGLQASVDTISVQHKSLLDNSETTRPWIAKPLGNLAKQDVEVQYDEQMQVFVRCNEITYAVVVSLPDKIEKLKSTLQDKTGIPPANQYLQTMNGKPLEDGFTFADYGIRKNSNLTMVAMKQIKTARTEKLMDPSDEILTHS